MLLNTCQVKAVSLLVFMLFPFSLIIVIVLLLRGCHKYLLHRLRPRFSFFCKTDRVKIDIYLSRSLLSLNKFHFAVFKSPFRLCGLLSVSVCHVIRSVDFSISHFYPFYKCLSGIMWLQDASFLHYDRSVLSLCSRNITRNTSVISWKKKPLA